MKPEIDFGSLRAQRLVRPHPGPFGFFLTPRLRPQPQERGNHSLPSLISMRTIFRTATNAVEDFRGNKAAHRAPSPGGEGGPKFGFAFASIAMLALMISSGCSEKPVATAPETEIRGQQPCERQPQTQMVCSRSRLIFAPKPLKKMRNIFPI